MKKSKTVWYPLDNAAKIYPPTASDKRPHVFSFSAFLCDVVEAEVLKTAVNNVAECNPIFKTKLMSGKFWYYLEENDAEINVFEEQPYYLKSIDYKRNNGYLFEVLYSEYKITINFFHALTDGTGGFNFFSQILLEYFKLMKYDVDSEGKIRSIDSPFFHDEGDDKFLLYDKKTNVKAKKIKRPYALDGTPFRYEGCGMITAVLPLDELKEISKSFNATITSYLGGLYIYCIYKTYLFNKPIKNKTVSLLVPCNLRKKYEAVSMRNFSMFGRVVNDFSENELSLRQCVELAQKDLSEQLSVEVLDSTIHENVKMEKNPFIKLVPLSIKNLIMRIAYKKLGENLQTGLFSNLGLVDLPESFSKHIKHLIFAISPTFSCKQQMTAIGYKNNLYLTFTRQYVENTIEKNLIRELSAKGINIKVFSNYWESQP